MRCTELRPPLSQLTRARIHVLANPTQLKKSYFPHLLAFKTSGSLPAKFREVPNARLFCMEDLVKSIDHTCYTVVNSLMENPALQHQQCIRAGREDKDESKATNDFMKKTFHSALCEKEGSCQCKEMWIMQSRTNLREGKVYSYRLDRVVVWMYFPVDLVVPPFTVDINNAGNGEDSFGGHDLVHETINTDLVQQQASELTLEHIDLPLPREDFGDLLDLSREDFDGFLTSDDSTPAASSKDFDGFLTSDDPTPAASSSEKENNCSKRTRLMDD